MSALDSYELGTVLGAGPRTRVHVGHRRADGRAVAVKIVHDPADLVARRRLLREAEVLEVVEHPAVLRVVELVDDDHLALVTDLVPGGDLAGRLARAGALPPSSVVELLLDVTAGVEAVHRRGFAHRDIRASNVLLDAGGRPVLAGLARAAPVGAGKAASADELRSSDPDAAEGLPSDERTDVHAVGVLAHELLTGGPPLPGSTPAGAGAPPASDPVVTLVELGVDGDLAAIVGRALDPLPHRRFPHAGALHAALTRWSESEQARAAAPLDEPPDERVGVLRPRPADVAPAPPPGEGARRTGPVGIPAKPDTTHTSVRDWIGEDVATPVDVGPAIAFGAHPPEHDDPADPVRRSRRPAALAGVIAVAVLTAVATAVLGSPTGPTGDGAPLPAAEGGRATPTAAAPGTVAAAPPPSGADRRGTEEPDGTAGRGDAREGGAAAGDPGPDCPGVGPAGDDALVGDITGDGCEEVLRFADGVLRLPQEAGGGRYAVGAPGDVAVLGDFACRGSVQLAVYRPEAGLLWHFPEWPQAGQALDSDPPLQVGPGVPEVVEDGPCVTVRIRPTAGSGG